MAVADQTIFRGDTPTFKFTVTDSAGVAVNLTGSVPTFMAKNNLDAPDSRAIFERACTITDAANGKCEVKLTAADTANAGDYTAELQLNFSAGTTIQTAGQFKLIISKDVKQTA